MDSAAMWAFGNRYHQQVRVILEQRGIIFVQERIGGHGITGIGSMAGSFHTAGRSSGADFQPPYFPPPFPQQATDMFSHSQHINDPYSGSLHSFQSAQVVVVNFGNIQM